MPAGLEKVTNNMLLCFPGDPGVKNPPCNAREHPFSPWSQKIQYAEGHQAQCALTTELTLWSPHSATREAPETSSPRHHEIAVAPLCNQRPPTGNADPAQSKIMLIKEKIKMVLPADLWSWTRAIEASCLPHPRNVPSLAWS